MRPSSEDILLVLLAALEKAEGKVEPLPNELLLSLRLEWEFELVEEEEEEEEDDEFEPVEEGEKGRNVSWD